MDNQEEELYQCVGACMADPDSGYCLGCGRPPLGEPGIVAEVVAITKSPSPHNADPDNPE